MAFPEYINLQVLEKSQQENSDVNGGSGQARPNIARDQCQSTDTNKNE